MYVKWGNMFWSGTEAEFCHIHEMDPILKQPPAHPPLPPQKKGMSAIAWVGIGCGGLLVVAVIAGILIFTAFKKKYDEFIANPEKAAAEMVISMNPDLELVSQDESTGEMTVLTKDGKEMTLSYGDIAQGKITLTDGDGNVTTLGSADLSRVPQWVPLPPDLSNSMSSFHTETGKKIAGQVSGRTGLDAISLEKFIQSEFSKSSGGPVSSSSRSSVNVGDTTVITVGYKLGERSIKAVITEKAGTEALLNLNYAEIK